MIIGQTVENHADLLKVVDNLLLEAGVDRKDLGGKLTFAGLDPIRPTVLKVGAAGAAVVAANAVVSALLYVAHAAIRGIEIEEFESRLESDLDLTSA